MYRNLLAIALLCLTDGSTYSDTNYRLNTPIVPARYVLTITPYFYTGDERAFTFDGIVNIQFTTTSNTNQIKIHVQDLNFTAGDIYIGSYPANVSVGLNAVNPLEFNTNYSFAYITLASSLQAGVDYGLQIRYKGPIREDLKGFYRNYYLQNGVKKWLGTTQLGPTHARKAFPCFDEPELKATFQIRIDRPAHYQPSLTNTEIERSENLNNGYVREYFYPTPRMSTYLVAFLISEFEAGASSINGTQEFGVYTRPDAKNQTQFAFGFGKKVVEALGTYFGIDYYSTDRHLRLDHVAIPNLEGGAMENWGLIKYREELLLFEPAESTPYFKYRVGQVIAHETTHMWFGNLVTCHWWSNIWLNEGFANYFQDYIIAIVDPNLSSTAMLVTGSVYPAYNADSSSYSLPITNNDVNSPDEIRGHFGMITYQKAASVIRMIHHLIQDDAFKYGLNIYLRNNSFGSGYPEKLYQGLSEGITAFNALSSYSNTNIADIMSSWITQAGHPVLSVNIDYDTETVTLTQKRYYIKSSFSSNETYKIPITYTTQMSPNFENTKPVFIMEDKTYEFKIQNISQAHPWVIFNVQETGLYRVNYDDHAWGIVSSALKSNDSKIIHPLNRAKIVNDLFALFFADQVSFSTLYDTLEFLHGETEYPVWYAAVTGFNRLWNRYLGDAEALPYVKEFVHYYLNSAVSMVGYDSHSDSIEFLSKRSKILDFACYIGHNGCLEKAVSLFQSLKMNGTEVIPSLRPVVYCNGLRFGDYEDYKFMWERMGKTNLANEISVIKNALSCYANEDMLKRYLVSMTEMNSSIQIQDLTNLLANFLSINNSLNVVLDSLKSNYSLWSSIDSSMDTILRTVVYALQTDSDFSLFESWLASCDECNADSKTATEAILVQAKAAKAWSDSHKADILKSFKGSTGGSSLAMSKRVISLG